MRTDAIVYGLNVTTNENWYFTDTFFDYGMALNDSNDKVGFGFQLDKTATISGVGMYLIDIIGSPPDYQLGIVTISAYPTADYADPSDTLYGGSTWQTFDSLAIGSGWSWINLDSQVSGIKGDHIAVVVKPGGTPPDSSNYVEINDESNLCSANPRRWRYNTYWSGYDYIPPAGIRYTDDTFLGYPVISPFYEKFSSPEEWGVEFQLPMGATCVGAVLSLYDSDVDAPLKIILADSADTELASLTLSDIDFIGGLTSNYTYFSWNTATNPSLVANTTYRLYLKPTSSDEVVKTAVILVDDDHKAMLPGGTNWKMIERPTPASGWSYISGGYPWMGLLLTDLSGENGGGNGGTGGGGSFGFIG